MHKLNKFLTGYGMMALGLATLALLFASMVVSCNEEPLHEFEKPLSQAPACSDVVTWKDPKMQAGVIKSWTTGEILRASDLNTNFSHIHDNMVGGHGARLVDADVASGAAIAHTKLATPALVPKAWAALTSLCDGLAAAGTACTVAESSQVTAVKTNGATGQYRVDLAYSPPNASFQVNVTAYTAALYCVAVNFTATTGDANGTNFNIFCYDAAGAATNSAFSFSLLDT
jgi:hypothetical protein